MLSLQPPELLDAIASLIPLPKDLLSLALVSKIFHAIIIPQHLEFRVVRCDAGWPSLWNALTEHPALAGRIMSLELRHEPVVPSLSAQSLVPKSLPSVKDTPIETCHSIPSKKCNHHCLDALCSAISLMPALERFCFDQPSFAKLHAIEPIFGAVLAYCRNLREVEIRFRERKPSFASISAPVSFCGFFLKRMLNLANKLWELANLTRVSIMVKRPMAMDSAHKYLTDMFKMLSRCPHLEHLRLASEIWGPPAHLSALLANISWPHLRRFIIKGDLTFSSGPAATAFLSRHPQLETLSLHERVDLPPLPHLRWLSVPEFFDGNFAVVPENLPLLEYAAMTDAYWPAQTHITEVIKVLLALPALRGATLAFTTPSALRMLSVEIPHLARLVLARSPWTLDRRHVRETRLPSAECMAILTSFAHLTHLDSSAVIEADPEHDPDAVLDAFLRALAGAPQLQYVGVDLKYSQLYSPVHRWFCLARDEQGGYAGRTEVRNLQRVRYHDWDDVFPLS
ncbi:hypothetical protein FB451DRAFT_1564745 [Mycena latifolia]|nr:hypothetical protein FB451DRAFT_1564745 [Mycena latifolia]